MQLFFVNTYISGLPQPIRLIFKSEERSKQFLAHPIGMDGTFTFSDDFGTELHLSSPPAGRALVNVVEQLEAEIELGLLQTRAQIKAQKRAAQDSTLSNGGGGIMMPGHGGGPVVPFPGRPLG